MRIHTMRAALVLAAATLVGCGGASGQERANVSRETSTISRQINSIEKQRAARTRELLKKSERTDLVAVGDIACQGDMEPVYKISCMQEETSGLITEQDEGVLVLGDTQYQKGEIGEYMDGYHRTWGRHLYKTYPVYGNHEHLSGGEGWRKYFYGGIQDKEISGDFERGWYFFDLNKWRVIILNSVCFEDNCNADGEQLSWLDNVLEQSERCVIMAWHHPRWSGGVHGDDARVDELWKIATRHSVEIVLSGHDHHYERLKPLDENGYFNPGGVRSFVVGTGGHSLKEALGGPRTDYVDFENFGVLRLSLGEDSYSWEFENIENDILDKGEGSCS